MNWLAQAFWIKVRLEEAEERIVSIDPEYWNLRINRLRGCPRFRQYGTDWEHRKFESLAKGQWPIPIDDIDRRAEARLKLVV